MLNTDFIHSFIAATNHILSVQANITSEDGKAFLKKQNDRLVGDVSGIISVVSDKFNGSVIISFPESTFLKVMSQMLGEDFKELSPEIIDGVGEILNIIFGLAKIVLNEKGYGIKAAIPSVITGKQLEVSTMTKGPVVVIPFTSSAGDFYVEICINH